MVCVLQSLPSQHTFRATRRHAARVRQENLILSLRMELASAKHELEQWWSWWQTYDGHMFEHSCRDECAYFTTLSVYWISEQ